MPPGKADDDRCSALDALDIDQDDSFRSVLALIRNFHSMKELAGVPSAQCKTSLASIYGLMSETSPAFHLPTSPLMRSLLDDTNLALSASQVSSMETMLSGICEVASWLDWWLSTCRGFRENLPVEVHADFERLILSGLRALEFLASQGCTALGNLVLSRRDSLLVDVRSTVPAEEVARLRYSPLPETVYSEIPLIRTIRGERPPD